VTAQKGVVLAVSAVILVLTAAYFAEALRYPRGVMADPGPGLYPLIVAAILALGAAGTALETMASRQATTIVWPEPGTRMRPVAILASAVAYVLLLGWLGHPVMATVTALVILHVMGMRAWPRKIAFALLVGLGSYALFDLVLEVPLPAGVLLT
jgi:putative tricarboxylic transport membrane protein